MTLDDYLKKNNAKISEGNSHQIVRQINLLSYLAKKKDIKNILEIGFNAGHSSEIFLLANPDCNVVSFDIGVHDYVSIGKKYIDLTFPNRHTLIIGNSLETIPKYYPGFKFDIIFIDGGHSYKTAFNDIINCKRFAHENTILVIDDVVMNKELQRKCNVGPTKALIDCKERGIIGNTKETDFRRGRGMSWGKYKF